MADFIRYIIIFGISAILAAIFVAYRKKEDEVFVKLSVIFISVFYLIPLYMLTFCGGFFYGLKFVNVDSPGVIRASAAIAIFVLGYFLPDLVNVIRRKASSDSVAESPAYEVNRKSVFLIFFAGMVCFAFYRAFAPSSDDLYNVRKGLDEGNHLLFLISIVSTTLMISAFFLCIAARWKALALVCITLIVIGYCLASPGRTTLSLTIILSLIFVFRLSPKVLVATLPLAILLLFPIIINGKELIYKVIVLGDFHSIFDLYRFESLDGDDVFSNLAHPLVSMIYADDLISVAGQRYFYDYIQGFLFYFRVFGIDFGNSLTYFNTYAILGINESIVPPGYVAFGHAQFPYIGIIVSGFFYRMTFRIFSRSALYKIAGGREMIFYGSFICANTFYIGDIRQLVISFFLVVLIMHVVGRLAVRSPARLGDPNGAIIANGG